MAEQLILILSILLFVSFGIYFRDRNFNSILDYTISRDSVVWFPIAAGISMSFAGGAAILNMASIGYTFGWYSLVDPISFIIGIGLVLAFIEFYRSDKGVTISDLFSSEYKPLSVLIGLVTSIVFIMILASQFVASSKLVSPYFETIAPHWVTIAISTTIYLYVFFGGFSSVTKTDILQFIFISLFLMVPFLYLILSGNYQFDVSTNYSDDFSRMPLNLIILFALPILFIPFSQDINIRVKSSKNVNEAKKGLIFGALIYIAIVLTSIVIGISLFNSGVDLEDSETAFTIFFQQNLGSFSVIGILAALAAIISSMDSFSLNAISSVSEDLLYEHPISKNWNQKSIIKTSGILVFILALGIALFFNEILTLILTSLLIYVSVLFPVALANYFKVREKTTFYSTFSTIIIIVLVEIIDFEITNKAIVYPIIGTICLGITVFLNKMLLKQ